MIFSCQKKCLNFNNKKLEVEERKCLKSCMNQMMFFDNMMYEFDTAVQIANVQDKLKKAYFYFPRRIEDLTSDN